MSVEMRSNSELEKSLWIDVWVACATASNSTRPHVCTEWADKALKDFRERFPKEEEKPPS